MAHTKIFDRFRGAAALASFCAEQKIDTHQGMERIEEASDKLRAKRREFLRQAGALGILGTAAAVAGPAYAARLARPSVDVGIVGAGLAGLACADSLLGQGVEAKLYEASDRVGGRQWSDRELFPGQVFERGGELIDNLHKTMLGYAQRFKLTRELQWRTFGGEETFYFNGQHWREEDIVNEYRVFVDAMREDLRLVSGDVTADNHSEYDRQLDNVSLAEYFDGRNAAGIKMGPIARAAIGEAYLAEYGLELEQQSSLNFLFFAKADRRARFLPFGIFSDERYHIVEGNDAIATGLRDSLRPGQLSYGMRLVRVKRRASGGYELTFDAGGRTVTRTHDAVVLTLPFSVLRHIELDANLELPAWKRKAIDELGYGTNAKQMIGFQGRVWAAFNSVGVSYSDLANHQNTWETNPSKATAAQAILTDYASGVRGAALNPAKTQTETGKFLTDLNKVWPGAAARALTDANGRYVSHIEPWPSNPLTRGSYTCYLPGQFTSIAGNEGKPIGNLFFAGEHADSFYSWQGFMEGACLSGLAAANEILTRSKFGQL